MLLFNIHIPLRSCLSSFIWNYFDIFKTRWIDAISQFNVRRCSLEWRSTASSQVCGGKCSTPLPRRWKRSAHFLGDEWRWGAVRRTDQARDARSDSQQRPSSRGGRCVPKIWGGSVGGVSPVKLCFLFTPSAASPHYWPLHCHFRSRCTLKDGGRLAGGGDRLGGEHKQGIIIHCIPRRSGPDWREQAGWKLFGAAWRLQREGTSRGNTSELSEWPVNTKEGKKKKTSVRWKVQPSFTVDWFYNRWR